MKKPRRFEPVSVEKPATMPTKQLLGLRERLLRLEECPDASDMYPGPCRHRAVLFSVPFQVVMAGVHVRLVAVSVVCDIAVAGLGCSSDADHDVGAGSPTPPPRATCEEYCHAVFSTSCFVYATESYCVQRCSPDGRPECSDLLALFRGCAVATSDRVQCGVNQYPVFLACGAEAAAYDYCVCPDCL